MRSTRLSIVAAVTVLGCSTAAPGSTVAPADAAIDAAVADASTAFDATPDDASDALVDAGPVGVSDWCGTQEVEFCDDFDEVPLAEGWDLVEAQHGSATLDGTTYTSPAESFLASTTPIPAGGVAYARVGKTVTAFLADMRFAFDVRPDALDSSGVPAAISFIELLDSSGQAIETINLLLSSKGASIDDESTPPDGGGSSSVSHPFSPAPALGAWTRVEIDLSLAPDAGNGTLTVLVGGSTTPALDHVPLGAASGPCLPDLFLGLVTGTGPAEAFVVRFDNVTFASGP